MPYNEINKFRLINPNEDLDFINTWENWSELHKELYNNANWYYPKAFFDPVKTYSGYAHKKINETLRVGWNCIAYADKEEYSSLEVSEIIAEIQNRNYIEKVINELRFSILSAPRIPENIIAWRWIPEKVLEQIISNKKKPAYYIEKGFLSTSLDPSFVFDENGNRPEQYKELLRLFIPKNYHGIYVELIEHRSEYELLLLDGIEFKYHGKELASSFFGNDKRYPKYIYDIEIWSRHE